MAELLVKAVSFANPDPTKDTKGCYKKGDIVLIMPDGHTWGAAEGLPMFVIVKCPGLSEQTIADRRDSWKQEFGYTTIATDPVLDGARYSLYQTVPGALNQYGITLAQVQTWITNWGGTVVSNTTNDVRFDITIAAAYQSQNFWGASPALLGVAITETAYDQGTGIHTATIDVSAATITAQQAQEAITKNGGIIQSFAAGVFTVTFDRATVRQAFFNDLREKTDDILVRRRYSFAPADVDTAIGLGGTVTLTQAQLVAKVLDKAA